VHLSNKFETLVVSEPSEVVQAMNREDPKPRLSNEKCKKILLLGSHHGRGLHGSFTQHFGMNVLLPVYSNLVLHLAML
jgi:hypothetical protein